VRRSRCFRVCLVFTRRGGRVTAKGTRLASLLPTSSPMNFYLENHYPRTPPRSPETALAWCATRHPKCRPILLVWGQRPVLSENPPDEVGKRHTVRLAISQRVSSSLSPPLALTRGEEVPDTASYTTQPRIQACHHTNWMC
jgi:hypothetical protein